MPIRVPAGLPAAEELQRENIFVMDHSRARTQDIRAQHILVLNLMPLKLDTERQLLRLLGNTPLQVDVEFLHTQTHQARNVPHDHLDRFYRSIDDVRDRRFDAMIVTGAPIERLPFEEVDYWPELVDIMEWSRDHIWSTFSICWGAQAALWHFYGVNKYLLPKGKLSGISAHRAVQPDHPLVRGFDEYFLVPHSRYTGTRIEDVEKHPDLDVLAVSDEAGLYLTASHDLRHVFATGHSEYSRDTLLQEYLRDERHGLHPKPPTGYFPNDDPSQTPQMTWRGHAQLLFANWLNFGVYQSTPYDWAR